MQLQLFQLELLQLYAKCFAFKCMQHSLCNHVVCCTSLFFVVLCDWLCIFIWTGCHSQFAQSQLDWGHAGRWQRARRWWRFQWSNELWPAAYAGDCLAAKRRLPLCPGVCCQWPCCLQLDRACRRSSRRICIYILRLLYRSKSLTVIKCKQLIRHTCCW